MSTKKTSQRVKIPSKYNEEHVIVSAYNTDFFRWFSFAVVPMVEQVSKTLVVIANEKIDSPTDDDYIEKGIDYILKNVIYHSGKNIVGISQEAYMQALYFAVYYVYLRLSKVGSNYKNIYEKNHYIKSLFVLKNNKFSWKEVTSYPFVFTPKNLIALMYAYLAEKKALRAESKEAMLQIIKDRGMHAVTLIYEDKKSGQYLFIDRHADLCAEYLRNYFVKYPLESPHTFTLKNGNVIPPKYQLNIEGYDDILKNIKRHYERDGFRKNKIYEAYKNEYIQFIAKTLLS